MKRLYIRLNGVQTPLITWGDPISNNENVIICITGNPGISDFYIEFASELFKSMSIPICVIGHAGHEESLDKKNKYLFNLKDQLEHKLDLIENHINKNSKIHLIGHSIGAWMIIELIHKQSIYIWIKSIPSKFSSAIIKILNPDVVENIFYLAFNEMDTVLSLNTESIQKIKHLTNVVYARNDGWAPVEYIEDLKQFTPQLQIREAFNVEHAFVLKSSVEVASIVADFINTKKNIS
ncbi:jg19470 [Pararge aegeria aegeria]|uniref:Lipid droplet-associated hydrolase n=1 Tax=Pararge aegeria aegeria TaxID=348720 RepID=A0A8S4R4K1_9NEOP|nr:jg19470 [Pararge aegeria aegeria]